MSCKEIREILSAYMDGELDGKTSRRMAEHMESCPGCGAYLQELRQVDAWVSSSPAADPGPEFVRRVTAEAARLSTPQNVRGLSPASRVKQKAWRFFQTIFRLFETERIQTTRTLDEFGDAPPLSMSCAYLRLLGESRGGC